MTNEQLEALEDWIVALVEDETSNCGNDGSTFLNRYAAKKTVMEAFGIEAGEYLK